MKSIKAYASFIIRFRFFVVILSFFTLGLAIYTARNLQFNNSNEMWFLKNDRTLLDYNKLLEYFGDDEFIVIGIENINKDSVFNKESITTINKITEFLDQLENVTKVQSLSKVEIITGSEDLLTVKKLFKGFNYSQEEYKAKEKIALKDPLINNILISNDATFTLIYVGTKHFDGTISHKVELSHKIKAFLNNIPDKEGFNFYLAGGPILDESFLSAFEKDQRTLIPIVLIIITIVIFYSFRSIAGVLLSVGVIIGSLLLVYFFMAVVGYDLNILNAIVPVIILAIGIADSVHILVDYYHEISMGKSSKEAAENSIVNLFTPCLFTSLTTSISFLAFTSSRIVPLKEFGIQASFGVLSAFILSISLLPALLSYMKEKDIKAKKITRENLFYNLFIKIANFSPEQNKKTILISVIITLIFIYFSFQVRVDANAMNYFRDDSPIKINTRYIDGKINGTLNAEFIVDAGENDGVKSPGFLKKLEKLQDFLKREPQFGPVISILDFIKKMNLVLHNDEESYFRIPETKEAVAQYLLLYSFSSPDEDLTDLVDFNYRFARVSVRIPIMNTSKSKILMKKVDRYLQKEWPPDTVKLTGLIVLFNNLDEYILDSQFTSFSLAFIFIFIMMILVFKSFKFGALSMIPNLLPVIAAGGIMGACGIYLEFGTVMVACVVIGIGVDDTIHYIGRYLRKRREGNSKKESIQIALKESGKPIIFTSIILFFGFFVLLFASLKSNLYFGLLVCIAVIIALLADLFFLSAILLSLPGKKS